MKNHRENISNFWVWIYRSHVLNSKNQEKGNTLIIAMSLGLIVLLATSVSLINSSKEKTNVQAGEFTKQAMGVAELGITRVHNFLAKNSKVAEFPLDQWAVQAGTMQVQGTFTNSSTTTNSTCSALTSSGGGGTTVTTLVDKFEDIGDTVVSNPTTSADFQKGGFRVTNYTLADVNFNPVSSVDANSVSVGQIYGHGILTVESKINPNATSLASLFASNPSTSQTKVEVAIPLKKATTSVPLPGVWISNQEIGSPTNSKIDATLLVPDCNNMGLNIMPGHSVIISTITFPPLPIAPEGNSNFYCLTSSSATCVPTIYNSNGNIITVGDNNITSSVTLPRTGDVPIPTDKNGTMVDVYTYRVNNISLNGSNKITITDGKQVDIHLYGNIDIGGSQEIDSRFKPENLRILGRGINTGSATSQEPHICLSGGAEVFGFVFAPDYAVGAAGTGGGNGFTGAVWARMFNPPSTCGSNTGQVVVVQDITDWESVGLVPTNIPPQIGTIARWERKGY